MELSQLYKRLAYLRTLADRPRLQAQRAVHLAWWGACRGQDGRRFETRRRSTLNPGELQAALATFAVTPLPPRPHLPPKLPSASTVRHYRIALSHLFTALDGKSGRNPLRDVKAPRSDDPEPRALPYAIIEAIFAHMPEQGGTKRGAKRGPKSKTRARLLVMAYVGLPPAQIARLTREDLDLDSEPPSVLVKGRRKGHGSRTARLPLTPDGVAALRAFVAAAAWGTFSTPSAGSLFRRAIQSLVDDVAGADWRAARALWRQLRSAHPYRLRHSFLTQVQIAGKDQRATQAFAMHTDARTTARYTLAAVDPRLAEVATLLANLPAGVPAKPADAIGDQRESLGFSRESEDAAYRPVYAETND